MKPIIIYVSGAPGAGKTTLARLLAERLYIPHISSDLIQGGIELTHPDHDRKAAISSAFMPLMVDMACNGISFVVDQGLQKDIAKTSTIDILLPLANVLYVHAQCADPIGRYVSKIETSDIPDIIRRRDMLLRRAEFHRNNLKNTADPINLDLPTIIVNTDDGYDPSLESILAFIQENKE